MQRLCVFLLLLPLLLHAKQPRVEPGIEQLFQGRYRHLTENKRVGLITNHTAIDTQRRYTLDLLKRQHQLGHLRLVALFAPEHGLFGEFHAGELVDDLKTQEGIPIYSLHGKHRRPNDAMLKDIDVLVYDIQDIGSRSYTYISTLFYVMEEAARRGIPVIVADRPNPMGGEIVDGPMMREEHRSFVGYVNVPYCHGMTVAELALLFNHHYKIDCDLTVLPMKGWKRHMMFADTGLPWIPTSPNIPESDTPLYYPTTGIIGEMSFVNIGIGFTLPFKLIGAPWIDAEKLADTLNSQRLTGVAFLPYYYKPFYGKFAQKGCHGVLIQVTDPANYLPVSTQFMILGVLKTLYPEKFEEGLKKSAHRRQFIAKINGTDEIYQIMERDRYIAWKLRGVHEQERERFKVERRKYLIKSYG